MATKSSLSSKGVGTEHHEKLSDSQVVQETQSEERNEEPFKFTFKLFLAFLSMQLGYMADVFVVNMARTDYSYISADIGPSPNNYPWTLVSINLTTQVLSPVLGRLSDVFERKIFLLAGNLFGIIGCAVLTQCKSMAVLIGASVLIVVHLRKGLFQGSLIVATAFSPLIAHALFLDSTWKDIYWIAFAHNIASFIGVALFYHPEKRNVVAQLEPIWTRFKRYDWLGSFLYVSMLSLIALGLPFGGMTYPWISVGTLLPTFLGVALAITFITWEVLNRRSALSFLPEALMRRVRRYDILLIILFLSSVTDVPGIIWPQEVQILFTQNQIRMGLYDIARGLLGPIFAPLVGYIVQRGYARWWLTFFAVALTIVGGAHATITPTSSKSSTALVALSGLFNTAVSVTAIGMLQVVVRHEHLGIATGLAQSIHSAGNSMSSIIIPVMLRNTLSDQVTARLVPAVIEAGVLVSNLSAALASILKGDFGSPALAGASSVGLMRVAHVLQLCYTHTFAYVYEVCITFGLLAVVVSLFTKDLEKYMSATVEVRLAKSKGLVLPDVEALAGRGYKSWVKKDGE